SDRQRERDQLEPRVAVELGAGLDQRGPGLAGAIAVASEADPLLAVDRQRLADPPAQTIELGPGLGADAQPARSTSTQIGLVLDSNDRRRDQLALDLRVDILIGALDPEDHVGAGD